MSFSGNDVKLSSFPVGESGTNVTTIILGHRSGKLIATGSEDGAIRIYTIGQTIPSLSLECQTNAISSLRFSNEENLLALGSRSGAVKICDLESQKVIHPGGHKTCIRSTEYFPSSNNFLATGAVDGTAKLWDPRRKGFIFNYKEHNGAINALKFSPDGRYLITASDDTTIRIWDITAGKIIKAFEEHQGPVFTVEYHPKELVFASAGADRRIKFWDLETMQFLYETPMETSAIKCLLFEPINGNYILSGSNDTLRIHRCEPVQSLDTIQMNWKNVLDINIHKDQLFGVSALQNKVFIASIDLSNIKTEGCMSPIGDYVSREIKTPSRAVSATSNSRSQYQAAAVKHEHVKLRPQLSNDISTDKSKASNGDIPMIDNREDNDQISRVNNRIKRSFSHQEPPKEIQRTSSLVEQVPSANYPAKPRLPSQSKDDVSKQSRTNEEILANLSKSNQTISTTQRQRMGILILLNNLSRKDLPKISFQTIIASQDLSLKCFFLRFVLEKLSKHDWNLDLCTKLLPAALDLIKSDYHRYNLIACQVLEKILSNFGKMIYGNIGAKSIGVDLHQQERRDKCQSCHQTLYEIRSLIDNRSKTLTDQSLKQAFNEIIRLLNAYERC